MTKEEVLTNLERSREALIEAIEGLSEQQMTEVPVEGVWTIKDVLGHIASWEQTVVEPLRRFAAGGPFEAQVVHDETAWNHHQAAQKRALSMRTILEQLASVRQELVEAASRLPEAKWERVFLWPWGEKDTTLRALNGLCGHEWEHLRTLQRWRAKA